MKYRILSPDGFDFERECPSFTKAEIPAKIEEYISRYKRQGYYSAVSGRIELKDLKHFIKIVPCES